MNGGVLAEVVRVWEGSDGDAPRALYDRLKALGPAGEIAVNLFRANKNSTRAKAYGGGIRGQGSYRRMAYDRKQWSLENLCTILYVDLPTGQVSFHTDLRLRGPDYPGDWTGFGSTERICRWCAVLLGDSVAAAPPTSVHMERGHLL